MLFFSNFDTNFRPVLIVSASKSRSLSHCFDNVLLGAGIFCGKMQKLKGFNRQFLLLRKTRSRGQICHAFTRLVAPLSVYQISLSICQIKPKEELYWILNSFLLSVRMWAPEIKMSDGRFAKITRNHNFGISAPILTWIFSTFW